MDITIPSILFKLMLEKTFLTPPSQSLLTIFYSKFHGVLEEYTQNKYYFFSTFIPSTSSSDDAD
jgi:hypothetical protein